jgi:hypothetical protein
MVAHVYNIQPTQYMLETQVFVSITFYFFYKILHINMFFTLHLCFMMGIIFDQYFESLKIRFTMYFLHAKIVKLQTFNIFIFFPKNSHMTM